MNSITHIKSLLHQAASNPSKVARFFKTGPGEYAEHDQFLGVSVPAIRIIAKQFSTLALSDIQQLIASPINEERLLALIILVLQYQKAGKQKQDALAEELFNFYLDNIQHVNNWNLVDSSAHLIIGAHLATESKELLINLAQSDNLWERRIAIVATWYFIRRNDLEHTFTIATLLLNDSHDLIHKAVGWMLREAGKKDETELIIFLDQHHASMPRTMVRYAIERMSNQYKARYQHS